MLKGQAEINVNMLGGTVLFFLVAMAIFIALVVPVIYGYGTAGTTENEVKAIEFSNVAKMQLLHVMGEGDGNINYSKLDSEKEREMTSLGLPGNYMQVENIYTEEYWKFGGSSGRFEHDTFSTASSNYINAKGWSDTVMSSGKEYVIYSYMTGSTGSMAVDIYEDFACSDEPAKTGYRVIPCSDAKGKIEAVDSVLRIKSEFLVPVSTGASSYSVVSFRPTEDVEAVDLIISGKSFGSGEKCLDERNMLCIRKMGNYVFPVRIHTEIGKDSPMSVTSVDGGESP